MRIAVLASADPGLVIGRAGELLAGDPVGYNVVGTKLADAIRYGEPGRYWTGLLDGVPAGVAVQQPADTFLAVAPKPAELATAVAGAVDAGDAALPGVFGPAPTASRFAEVWAGLRKVAAVPMSQERLYEVRDLRFPHGVAGALRRAAGADREVLLSWLPGSEAGAGWAASDPAAVFVNTPPELRGRGYASAGVAALSASVLAQGFRCVLNANVDNLAATSVCERLGYQAVSDVRRYRLG